MFKFLNRGISTPIAIGIIAVLVVVVGGGILAYQYYYIPKQEIKNTEIKTPKSENNYEKIAGDLMQNYLEQYKSVNVVQNKRLASYKINKIDVGSFDDKNQCFRFTVDFSVETAIKPVEGNMVKSDWIAGNGSVGSGNWINNKSLVFSVLKENDNYKLIDAGTGSGGGSCAIPGKYFSAVLKETDILKDGTVNWKIYTDNEFGFSFYYPKLWKLNVEGGVITLTNFGPYYDDRIIISEQSGNQIKNTDAKFGDVIYYYDDASKSWMVNKNTDFDSGIKKATTNFYTISNFPVFSGVGRWKTNIVPISTNKFLIVNIAGSGFTGVLDSFTETISEVNANISSGVIDNLIKTQMNNEHGGVIKGWLEGTTGNWVVAETTKSLSGYSGSKFALKFNDKSNCVYVYSDKIGDFKSFPCLNQNPPSKWGYGDRVRVYGKIGADQIEVSAMEIVSSLPVNQW